MRFIILLLCLVVVAAPARAESLNGLEIEALFDKIEEIYTGETLDMDNIIKYSKEYTSEDYVSIQEARSNLGKKVIFDKVTREEFLTDLANLPGELLNTKISHTITDIRYFDDNIRAEVDYTSLFKGQIKKEFEGKGMEIIKFQSLSVCTEYVRLEKGELKSYKSDCKTEHMYAKPEPVIAK